MKKVKKFLKRHFTANPLSYLGWLGVLGIIGVFFAPVFIPFLLCFPFFSYSSMVADELFWDNVHRASGRAFWSVFGLDVLVAVILFIRGMTMSGRYGNLEMVIQESTVSMGIFTYDQYVIVFFAFFGSITLMLLVFTISMMRFKKQEKKMLEEA